MANDKSGTQLPKAQPLRRVREQNAAAKQANTWLYLLYVISVVPGTWLGPSSRPPGLVLCRPVIQLCWHRTLACPPRWMARVGDCHQAPGTQPLDLTEGLAVPSACGVSMIIAELWHSVPSGMLEPRRETPTRGICQSQGDTSPRDTMVAQGASGSR